MRAKHQAIIDILKTGNKIVTASHRQARFIQNLWQQYNQQLLSEDSKNDSYSWEQADCVAWDEWLSQNFEICTLALSLQGKSVPKLLSSLEQRWLWQKLLAEVSKDNPQLEFKPLNQQQTLLSSLLQGWTLYNHWQLQHSSEAMAAFNQSEETRLFRKIVKLFNQQCDKNNWISKDNLADFIAAHFELWKAQSPVEICFYGFDDWTPQQQNFLSKTNSLQTVDFNLVALTDEKIESNERLHPCASKYAEWQQAAIWARQQSEKNPQAQIAVVIPSLESERAQVLRIFQEVFQPQMQLHAEAVVPAGFNISVGEAINQQAIISSARRWLSLVNGAKGEIWKEALIDRFCVGANTERWARASIAKSIDLSNNTFYSIEVIQKILSKEDIIPLAKWADILQILREACDNFKATKSTGEWCLLLEQFLENIGWPGASILSSQTFQAKTQWLEKMRQLSAMDQFCGMHSFADFMTLLDEQMNSSKFQPQTPASRVQVLGVFEAIGLSFDYLWLAGCQDNVFPATLNASPWLPVNIQQKLHMPGASSQREQQLAAKLFVGMQKNCSELHYSFALTEGDAELKASAFVTHLFDPQSTNNCVEKKAPEQLPNYWNKQLQLAQPSVSIWRDTQGEKLASGDVRSGVGILKNQASCPFKAYAEYRLSAASNREQTIGIDPMQRGNWVHDVLEMVWLRLGVQKALVELSNDELVNLVTNCATEIILRPSKGSTSKQNIVQNPLIQLEVQRTILLVLSWLEIDRERAEFFKVEVEQSQQVSIANLNFMVRADRIDDLGGGKKIVIDYKTGLTSNASWFNERITEPQLPLYGLLFTDNLSAIAVAELTTAGCKLKGCGEDEIEIKGVKAIEDWPDLIHQWKINLETVAMEYSEGFAAVDPDTNACVYCEYAHLCRRDAYFIEEQIKESIEEECVKSERVEPSQGNSGAIS